MEIAGRMRRDWVEIHHYTLCVPLDRLLSRLGSRVRGTLVGCQARSTDAFKDTLRKPTTHICRATGYR
ncbi:hypothetical protein D3C76_874140 [compost metagenome]